jgi:hypothetical protein
MSTQLSARVAPVWADTGVKLLLVLAQVLGQGLEALGALLKVQLEQIGQAHRAGVVHRLAKVDGVRMGLVRWPGR